MLAAPAKYPTLESVNRTLTDLSLAPLTAHQLRYASQKWKPEDLRLALDQAPQDPQWSTWLSDVVAQIQRESPAASQAQLPPPPAANAPQRPAEPTALPGVDRLNEINRVLNAIGCNEQLTVRDALQLAEDYSKEDLQRAVAEAATNPRAAAWLKNCVKELKDRQKPRSATPSSPQPSAPVATDRNQSSEPASRDQDPDGASSSHARFDQHICYGAKAAICFSIAELSEQGRQRSGYDRSIMLKAAQAKDNVDCKKGVAWNTGVCVNLGQHEVQFVGAVLLGMMETVRFAGHGHAHDKWFEVTRITDERFKGGIRVSVAEGKGSKPISVNITPTDVGAVLSRFLRVATHQLRLEEHPNLLIPTLRASVDLYIEAQSRQQGNSNQR